MAVRYSRRANDGTTEYHDSRESLYAAQQREALASKRHFYWFVGLIVGGALSYVASLKFGAEWPKWGRFLLVILGAGATGKLLAMLTPVLSFMIRLSVSAAFLIGIGWLIWLAL
ncbi:hypothetical protein [Nitrogeniibacter aestuarii]|uniref:hypothetical protein n=1 Tax=Nitrogeniibacter aestuarii TaxID=2815343 RepID=UPI001D11E7CA|nr:hypothetical protein [Nitrogeniibacter aestuarii]